MPLGILTAVSSWQGFPEKDIKKLEDYGFIQSRPKGEFHVNNQQMSKLLHKAVGLGGKDVQNGQVCPPPPGLSSQAAPLVKTRRITSLLAACKAIPCCSTLSHARCVCDNRKRTRHTSSTSRTALRLFCGTAWS